MISKYDIVKYAKQFQELADRGELKEKAEKLIRRMVKDEVLDKGELIDTGYKVFTFNVLDAGEGDRHWPTLEIDKGNKVIGWNVFRIVIDDTVNNKFIISA